MPNPTVARSYVGGGTIIGVDESVSKIRLNVIAYSTMAENTITAKALIRIRFKHAMQILNQARVALMGVSLDTEGSGSRLQVLARRPSWRPPPAIVFAAKARALAILIAPFVRLDNVGHCAEREVLRAQPARSR